MDRQPNGNPVQRASFFRGSSLDATRNEAIHNRAILSAIPDMMFTFDRAGRFLSFTPAEGMTPIVPAEAFLGRAVREVMPPEVAEPAMKAIALALETLRPQCYEYGLWEENKLRQYEARLVALGPNEVLAIVRDQTAQAFDRVEQARHQKKVDALASRAEAHMAEGNPYALSFREFMVLTLIADGLSDKEIAAKLGRRTPTVNKHVTKILAKMGAASRTEAAVRAQREGLLEDTGG
jgi:DNA-binding CsgD family transcriptional regulator